MGLTLVMCLRNHHFRTTPRDVRTETLIPPDFARDLLLTEGGEVAEELKTRETLLL